MLLSLKVTNIALIEDIEIQFDHHLNILSGETGAGKSIILDSIALILGEPGRVDFIRTDKDEAKILAIFDIEEDFLLKEYLKEELGIDISENLLIIERKIFRDKRPSLAFINHQRVLIQVLKNLGEKLISIHSQHENQELFNPSLHLKLLDQYAQLEKQVKIYQEEFEEALTLKKRLSELKAKKKEQEEKKSFYLFAYQELEDAHLQDNETGYLEEEIYRLNAYQETALALQEIYALLYEDEQSIIPSLKKIQSLILKLQDKIKNSQEISPLIEKSLVNLEPVLDFLKEETTLLESSPQALEEKQARYHFIKGLERKYSKNLQELILYHQELKETLDESSYQDNIQDIETKRALLMDNLKEKALEISKKREVAAVELQNKLKKELEFLKLPHTDIQIDLQKNEDENGSISLPDGKRVRLLKEGLEKVEFLVSFNKGESLKSLSKVASGGEISRITLALKTVLQSIVSTPTEIFDEIDAGIGGETAFSVGKKLKEISKTKQVICITHLAQIAAMGDLQYQVLKIIEDNRTKTTIKALSRQERIQEISRMLSGDQTTAISIEHAKKLLDLD